MKTPTIPTLSQITNRVVAVDEEMGVVVVRMNFGAAPLSRVTACWMSGIPSKSLAARFARRKHFVK
jgi:hypothetical protein